MQLETERLILRPFSQADAEDIFLYLHEPSVNCFMDMKLNTLEDAREGADGKPIYENTYQYAILKKEWKSR